MLAKLKDETLSARLADVRTKPLGTVLADSEAHVVNKKLGHKFGNVEADALFKTSARAQ